MRTFIQLDVALAFAVLAGLALAFVGADNAIDNLQHDLVLAQNHGLRPAASRRSDARVAVVAVDERSLQRLSSYPRVLLAPKWAELIDALATGGAAAIGFDFVLAYPDTHFAPGWERTFLRALAEHKARIVLGRSERMVPARRFQLVFADAAEEQHFGALEVRADRDNVHRRVRAHIPLRTPAGDMSRLPTLTNLLLRKAGHGAMPETVRLAPLRAFEALPGYALSDVLDCAADGAEGVLRRAFGGRVVLVGTTLRGEDRKVTADRFLPRPSAVRTGGEGACRLAPIGAADPRSSLVPSVFLHAAAIDAVIEGRVVRVAGPWLRLGLAALVTFAAAWAALVLRPWRTAIPIAGGAVALHVATSLLLAQHVWLPSATTAIATLLAASAAYLVRYLLVDRQRRLVQRAFENYLSEEIVDRIIESERPPALGGERRDITVMFADLSGFMVASEKLSPERLMELTNDYLRTMVDEIHAAGGYVDKFIGDAMMALWGAPGDQPDHAAKAVRAGLDVIRAVREKRDEAEARGEPGFDVTVAINSGPAIVGNVGTANRLAYTGAGRAVNIAARLEGLVSTHETAMLIGEDTAARVGDAMALRQIGEAQFEGMREKVALYVPAENGVGG